MSFVETKVEVQLFLRTYFENFHKKEKVLLEDLSFFYGKNKRASHAIKKVKHWSNPNFWGKGAVSSHISANICEYLIAMFSAHCALEPLYL